LCFVSELLDELGNWKEILVRSTFHHVDADLILKIKPSRRASEDIIAWHLESSGSFSVRSAYKLALNDLPEQQSFTASSDHPHDEDCCWSIIWKGKVPPKVRTFAWKAASRALATEENKLRRNMRVTGICNICGMEKEDTVHVWYRCPQAFSLWHNMREVWNLPTNEDMQFDSPNWFRALLSFIPVNMVEATLLVCWRA
jgi:hypothetical protein